MGVIWLYCPKDGCDNRPFKATQAEIDNAEGVIFCEQCGGNCIQYFYHGITLTVGDLKRLLDQFDDSLEVYAKPSQAVGDTGAIHKAVFATGRHFGEDKVGLVLTI